MRPTTTYGSKPNGHFASRYAYNACKIYYIYYPPVYSPVLIKHAANKK